MFYELKYEGWASQYNAGRSYAVFLRVWAAGQPLRRVVVTLPTDDAKAIGLAVGDDEMRAAVIREAVRKTSSIDYTKSRTDTVDLARSDVEAMLHCLPALPELRQDTVVGTFNR